MASYLAAPSHLPEPVLNQIFVTVWRFLAPINLSIRPHMHEPECGH